MLNEERIRLMTDIAFYEKQNGRRMKGVTSYFKSDYISRHLIRGFLNYTISFVLLFVIWVLFNMDVFLSTIGLDALVSLGKKTAVFYFLGMAFYLGLLSVVYGHRYETEARKIRIYTAKLKHLDKRYEYHNRSRELTREGRRT